jgi:hypothetical protein
MKISDFLSPTCVMLDIRASDKTRLLEQLSVQAATGVGLDVDEVSTQIAKREELGSTGVGNGVALPHARIKGLKAPLVSSPGCVTGSTLTPSTTNLSTLSSCSCSLTRRTVTRSSMRWPAWRAN